MKQVYVALLRGINVGGKNKLSMQELRDMLDGIGCEEVKTYIQSGNIIFSHESVPTKQLTTAIKTALQDTQNLEIEVLVMTSDEFQQISKKNSFKAAEKTPASLHLFFLSTTPPNPNLEKMQQIQSKTEQFELNGRCFYLYAHEGIGRSKLASQVEKLLGVPTTARNWRTVTKINEMLGNIL